MVVPSIFRREPILWPLLALLAAIWVIPYTRIPDVVEQEVQRQYEKLPIIKIDYHPSRTFRDRFSTNRTALYIETREEIKYATPLLLHMTQVIPPEWRFLFIGTEEMVERVNKSSAIRRLVQLGKLRLGQIERWTDNWNETPDIHETHSRLLTNISFYNEQLPGVEWLLNFRSSAIICANANRTVNDYLQYDWVGAPWNANDNFGGNGGLSLRRLSRVRKVLEFQSRVDGWESEDRWMSKRIGLLPGANCANGTIEKGFSVEDIWHDQPLGYHINPTLGPGTSADVWNTLEKRKQIYSYCPEIKMIMNMRLERERCNEEVKEVVVGYDPNTGAVDLSNGNQADGSPVLAQNIDLEQLKATLASNGIEGQSLIDSIAEQQLKAVMEAEGRWEDPAKQMDEKANIRKRDGVVARVSSTSEVTDHQAMLAADPSEAETQLTIETENDRSVDDTTFASIEPKDLNL